MKTLKITRYTADNTALLRVDGKEIVTIGENSITIDDCLRLVDRAYSEGYKAAYRDMRISFYDWVGGENVYIQKQESIITKTENVTL